MRTWLRLDAVCVASDPGLGVPIFADPGLLEKPCSNILQVWSISELLLIFQEVVVASRNAKRLITSYLSCISIFL
jgi:hypothetical protein